MRCGIRRWSRPLVYVAVMVLIALAASLWRGADTCEMDGQAIVPNFQTDLRMSDGWHSFCSIQCARRWLSRRPDKPPREAVVRDALTGRPIDSYTAFFVRSQIVTNPANGNNIHAFQYRTDAAEHLRRFHGEEVDDPFEVQ